MQPANRYIERIRYGNEIAKTASLILTDDAAVTDPTQWHFEVVFDYGEYNIDPNNATPYNAVNKWACRPDSFSTYHAGFEMRTHRRCLHTLMFHRFVQEFDPDPVLVHATAYEYQPNYAQMSECVSTTNTGYTYDSDKKTYTTAALPPLSLQYTNFQPTGHKFVPLTTEQGQALQGLDNPPNHTLVDLFGEGIPGVLYTDGASTYYRDPVLTSNTDTATASAVGIHPLSNTAPTSRAVRYDTWQELASCPAPKRMAGDEGVMLKDINGNAQLDVVMETTAGMRGYWEAQPDRSWRDFQAFGSRPAEYPAPSQAWVDMTGDGIADLVQLTEQAVHIYPSTRSKGLGQPIVQQQRAGQGMPPSLAGSPTEVVQFADMAGSGQSHLVRIRNQEVVYWPNLSYGRIGNPITMANAPDFGQDFNSARLFLADLDGSGTTDLIYMETTQATIYFNQSGNAFSDPIMLKLPFSFDDLDQVTFADVYGQGNACLVISETHHLPTPKHWCYDFCQGQKPYLLNQLDNNLGATTAITYGSSVDFYLKDKKEDLPSITALPFPVHVVTQVTHEDAIAGSRYTSHYSYHHGYYDGVEREFHGFGRVDRQDAEYFSPSQVDPDKHPKYVAPSLSRTWYHTGAYRSAAALSKQYAQEYYAGDEQAFDFPNSTIEVDAPDEETKRQAYVAMAGTVLRTELYGLDDSKQADIPYSVSESSFRVVLKQAKGDNPYAIFLVHPAQSLTYTYERDPKDPQIHQETTLQLDAYGNVERSCAIAYPRRAVSGALREQQKLHVTCATQSYVNQADPKSYLLGVLTESQSYEITTLMPPPGKMFSFETLSQAIDAALDSLSPSNPSSAEAKLLGWERLYYAPIAASGSAVLPLGKVALPLLLAEHHVAEFLQDQVAAAFQDTPLKGQALTDKLQAGYYQLDTTCNYWWNPGLTEIYNGADQFYMPKATKDPAGNKTQYTYDTHHLLLTEVRDALNNTVQAQAIDYQHLHPMQLVDANGNTSEVKLDPLGRVIYTSHYGHEAGKSQGFARLSEAPTAIPSGLQDILKEPGKYLGNAQSYFYYDPFAWQKRQEPVWSLALVAEQYPDSTGTNPIQIHLRYNDGLGRDLCSKSKVEPGDAFLYDAKIDRITYGKTQNRWLTTGRTIYNNKGKAVKQYEPYYIDTPAYVRNAILDTFGVSPTLYYDPLGRLTKVLTAKGFWVRHTCTPWEEAVYDQNDTLQDSPYYQVNIIKPDYDTPFYNPDLSKVSKENLDYVAQYFADTPSRTIVDNLGHAIIEEHINQSADNPEGETLQTHHSYDILGRELTSADPRLCATQRHNFETVYSLVGHPLQVKSADAGTRWALTNTLGNLIWAYDERQIAVTTSYDALHRPSHVHVHKPATDQDSLALNQVVERFIYGDTPGTVTDPAAHNLRGQLYQHYDQAGLVTTPSYSLLGKSLETQRQFRVAYKTEANWNDMDSGKVKALLEPTVYKELASYDALGRVTQDIDADGNKVVPVYHLSGRLNQITLTPQGDGQPVQVVQEIIYNAKSQREQISYGNNTTTTYSYDLRTFAVTGTKTVNSQGKKLQDLRYVYDPVGNVVSKTDAAAETVFYGNQQVKAMATYTYDSLYRLMQATGREKAGGSEATAGREIPIVAPHAHDNQALQNYVERYSYDQGNNLTQTRHTAGQKSWTREMVVSATSNRAVLSTINGQDKPTPIPEQVDQYFDKHGNHIHTQMLYPLAWNYRDNLEQATVVMRPNGKHDAEYYVYDGTGQRVRKVREQYGEGATSVTIKETLYLGHLEYRRTRQGADPSNATITKEYHSLRVLDDQQCVATRDYWVKGNPPIEFKSPAWRYHLDDHLDSCTVEVDDQGLQISREEYSPFGSSTLFIGTVSDSQLKHYRYSGQERDSVTGFYYYGARYYAPWLARWLSPDPAGTIDGLNIYAFVTNSPVTFRDVGGMGRVYTEQKFHKHAQTRQRKDRSSRTDTELQEESKNAYEVYKAAQNPTLRMHLMGRLNDLEGGHENFGRLNEESQSAGHIGSILHSKKWTPLMNDAWILGGIHGGIPFHLASKRTVDNIKSESTDHVMTITGRELLGLRHGGYRIDRAPTGEEVAIPSRLKRLIPLKKPTLRSYGEKVEKYKRKPEKLDKLINRKAVDSWH